MLMLVSVWDYSIEAHAGVLYSIAYRAFRYIIVTSKHTYTP
jgi:hypothetical protein